MSYSTAPALQARFHVPFEYRVLFTRGLFQPENPTLIEALAPQGTAARALFIVDSGVVQVTQALLASIETYAQAHPGSLELLGAPVVVPGGEACKNDPALQTRLHQILAERSVDRHAYCVILGGGAVLDAAGFAAASAHRGVRVVRVPTTVLAQNDSGIGVKNGINAQGAKNFLGSFAPPWAVILDSAFLSTLSDRDFRAGIAESIKVALLKDAGFFAYLCEHATELRQRDAAATAKMIRRGAELHLKQITEGGDPFERGSARPLDFGHWAAHRLEGLSHYSVRHGEAVAIGMALDTLYALEKGLTTHALAEQLLSLLSTLGFELYHPALSDAPDGSWPLWEGLREFQEHLGGQLTITLVQSPGVPVDVHTMDRDAVRAAVEVLRARSVTPVTPEAGAVPSVDVPSQA